MHESVSDTRLFERASGGDQAALVTLLERYGPRIERELAPKIGAKWRGVLSAEDVMQITYVEVFLHIEEFQSRGDGAFSAWLRRIAENNLRDAVRNLGRQKRPQPEQRIGVTARDASAAALLDQLGFTNATPSRQAGKVEAESAVASALERLPDDYARVIRMYELDGATIADVARAMGRSEGAVFMLRSRALDRLREVIGTESMFFTDPA